MQNQKGFSTILFLVIVVVLLIGFIGAITYFLNNKNSDPLTLQCGTATIKMPQDYMSLPSGWESGNTGNRNVDSRGCYIYAKNCGCNKKAQNDIITFHMTTTNASSIQDEMQGLKTLAQGEKDQEGQAGYTILVKEEYSSFQGGNSLEIILKDPSNGDIQQNFDFFHNKTLYGVSLIAQPNNIDIYWPKIENSINSYFQ